MVEIINERSALKVTKKSVIVAMLSILSFLCVPLSAMAATLDHPSDLKQCSVDLKAGWSLFSFSCTPLIVEPELLFNSTGINIENKLYGFDPYQTTQDKSVILYNQAHKKAFGPVSQNLGYWLNLEQDQTLDYWGMEPYYKQSTWLHKGLNLIAYPFAESQDIKNFYLRNHTSGEEISFQRARDLEIVDSVLIGWTNDSTQGALDVGLASDWMNNNTMEANHGYWLQANEENWDLVIYKPGFFPEN